MRLTCCVCGAACKGKQWWNRDDGFGICASCAEWMRNECSPEEHVSYYGHAGIHYEVDVKEATK